MRALPIIVGIIAGAAATLFLLFKLGQTAKEYDEALDEDFDDGPTLEEILDRLFGGAS